MWRYLIPLWWLEIKHCASSWLQVQLLLMLLLMNTSVRTADLTMHSMSLQDSYKYCDTGCHKCVLQLSIHNQGNCQNATSFMSTMNRLVGGLYFMYINLQVTNKPLNFVLNSMEVPTLQTLNLSLEPFIRTSVSLCLYSIMNS